MMSSLRTWAAGAVETLDDPHTDSGTIVASLRDIARINRVFGGCRATVGRLDEFLAVCPAGASLTLLDVGTGTGDIPRAAAARAGRRGLTLRLVGLERHPAAAREAARQGGLAAVIADGGRLPMRTRSVDLVLCSKLLHHLPGAAGTRLLSEMDRVARRGVVVADIHRSALAAAGIWLASFPLRFHPATRHDGVISVFRGFSPAELHGACAAAHVAATIRSHPGWCLTAAWRPAGAQA
ncbi:MAG: methyltransferase domain-containing protein [Gemmatimonadales bacterium]|nr:methyltransferase domain-containing protein [Gemmatimonadales bacterium]